MAGMNGLWIYLAFLIPPILIALWAQWRVKSAYARAAKVAASSGLTGHEVAEMILESSDIRNVRVEGVQGFLSDHYDPSAKVLRLSPDVYNGRSAAALGIAAHEVGHAIQDARGYAPLKIRNGIVPLAAIGGNLGIIMCAVGVMIAGAAGASGGGFGKWILLAGIGLFSLTVIFQLINLPVEFDASNRAKRLLENGGLLQKGEQSAAMRGVLDAAAWTYIAATLGAIMTLAYYLLIFMQSQNRE